MIDVFCHRIVVALELVPDLISITVANAVAEKILQFELHSFFSFSYIYCIFNHKETLSEALSFCF